MDTPTSGRNGQVSGEQFPNQHSIPSNMCFYTSGTSAWSRVENDILVVGLKRFPPNSVSGVTRYAKIASMLPTKTIRDVAHKVKQMQDQKSVFPNDKVVNGDISSATSNAVSLEQDQLVQSILGQNLMIINTMRDNLLNGRLDSNRQLADQFRENISKTIQWLNRLPAQLPPLPVQINATILPSKPNM